jgi:hypothetical protein
MFRTLRAAFAAAGLLALVAPVLAKPVNVPTGSPIISVNVPAGWATSSTDRGLEVSTQDEEVFIWVETFVPAQRKALVAEHESYFAKQGVKIAGEPEIKAETQAAFKVQATNLPATWNGKPTILRYLAYDLNLPGQTQILFTYWASPEGDKKYQAAIGAFFGSLDAPK